MAYRERGNKLVLIVMWMCCGLLGARLLGGYLLVIESFLDWKHVKTMFHGPVLLNCGFIEYVPSSRSAKTRGVSIPDAPS